MSLHITLYVLSINFPVFSICRRLIRQKLFSVEAVVLPRIIQGVQLDQLRKFRDLFYINLEIAVIICSLLKILAYFPLTWQGPAKTVGCGTQNYSANLPPEAPTLIQVPVFQANIIFAENSTYPSAALQRTLLSARRIQKIQSSPLMQPSAVALLGNIVQLYTAHSVPHGQNWISVYKNSNTCSRGSLGMGSFE